MIMEHPITKKWHHTLIFEAEDVNDPDWDKIIEILRKQNITVTYGDGNWMNFNWEYKR